MIEGIGEVLELGERGYMIVAVPVRDQRGVLHATRGCAAPGAILREASIADEYLEMCQMCVKTVDDLDKEAGNWFHAAKALMGASGELGLASTILTGVLDLSTCYKLVRLLTPAPGVRWSKAYPDLERWRARLETQTRELEDVLGRRARGELGDAIRYQCATQASADILDTSSLESGALTELGERLTTMVKAELSRSDGPVVLAVTLTYLNALSRLVALMYKVVQIGETTYSVMPAGVWAALENLCDGRAGSVEGSVTRETCEVLERLIEDGEHPSIEDAIKSAVALGE